MIIGGGGGRYIDGSFNTHPDFKSNPLTGIPIQLSKNWHADWMPPYGRFYTLLPAKALAASKYHIRCCYGFWGTLPAASHANLSLVGTYVSYKLRILGIAASCLTGVVLD